MRTLLFILTSLLIGLTPAAVAQGFDGTWNSDFGTVRLWEEYKGSGKQNVVYGTFGQNGFITGRSNGKTLRGVFVHADPNTGKIDASHADSFGTFEWNMTSDYKRFNGPKRTGKSLPNGSRISWAGRFASTKPPAFDRKKLRRYSALYLIEAGNTLNKWMQAVGTLDGAGYTRITSDMLGEFEIYSAGSLSSSDRAAVSAFRSRNPGLPNTCYFYGGNEAGLRCDLRIRPGKTVSTLAGSKVVGEDGYPVKRTLYLDATKCISGTVRVEQYYLVCDYAGWGGSYAKTCDKLELQGHVAKARAKLVSYCKGPVERIGLSLESKTLFNKSGKKVVYFKAPHANEHASAADRYYKSELDLDHYRCPGKKLWNNNGYLNCSK